MPRAKKKTTKGKAAKKITEKAAKKTPESEPEQELPGVEIVKTIVKTFVPAVEIHVLPVEIYGGILVAKPVPHEVAEALSSYSPTPPRRGGEWTEKEKEASKRRERKKWKRGKRGDYDISKEILHFTKGCGKTGYGIPSAAVVRAMQVANRIMPGHQLPEELMNVAIKVPPHDPVKSLLRVTARRGPFMKEDTVRIGHKPGNEKGTPSLTVRVAWIDWKINLEIHFTKNLLEGEQVFNLLMWAGQCGLVEGRPSKGSALNWGMFDVRCGTERVEKIGTFKKTGR